MREKRHKHRAQQRSHIVGTARAPYTQEALGRDMEVVHRDASRRARMVQRLMATKVFPFSLTK